MPEFVFAVEDGSTEFQIREGTEERLIIGRIAPFGQRIQVRKRKGGPLEPESFAPGSFTGIDLRSQPVPLFINHGHQKGDLPVGVMVDLEERSDGAYATFRVAEGARGDEVLSLVRQGMLTGLSPGFQAAVETARGVITRLRRLFEVSLTNWPAYSEAQVLATREEEAEMPEGTETIETEELVQLRSQITGLEETLQTRMESMEAEVTKLSTLSKAPAAKGVPSTLTPFNWFVAQCRSQFSGNTALRDRIEEDFETFRQRVASGELEWQFRDGLEDITGGETQAGDNSPTANDLSGLVVEEFMADQLVHILNTRRPMFRNLGSIRMPRSGYATIPTITQNTDVAKRDGQKQEANTRKLISKNSTFKAEWLDGAVDVALELIRTADLSVLQITWNDLLGQYAKATEIDPDQGVVSIVEAGIAGAVYTDVALPVNTYAAFIAAVLAQADVVEDATDAPATKLFVTRAQFNTIAAFVDADGRRLFSAIGSTNADAVVPLGANEIALPGGIVVVKARSADLTQAVLTNEEAIKVADGGPERVEALNVALMGHDLGILGRTLVAPRIPGGVVVFGSDPLDSP